jgi:O-antigen/teichoic acid export membrane protein
MESSKHISTGSLVVGVQAIAGLLINVILLQYDNGSFLGVFNKTYAFFIILGQLLSFGVHDAALRKIASINDEIDASKKARLHIFISSIILLIISILIVNAIGLGLENRIKISFFTLAPAIGFFVFNKIALAVLNGSSQFKLFFSIHALRAILICSIIVLTVTQLKTIKFASLAFFISELIIFGILLFNCYFDVIRLKQKASTKTIKDLFIFGIQALPHAVFTEAFFRIDIIMISFFLSDEQIGKYSFIAFTIEGIMQFAVTFRTILNPKLSKHFSQYKVLDTNITKHIIKTCLACGLLVSFICLAFIIARPTLFHLLSINELDYKFLYSILLSGLVISSFFTPLEHYFIQLGRPIIQSYQLFLATLVNVLLNFFLIPKLGLTGAAYATSISLVTAAIINFMLILYFSTKKRSFNKR